MANNLNTVLTDIATSAVLESFGEFQAKIDLFTTEIGVANVGTHRVKVSPTDDATLIKNGSAFGDEDSNLTPVDVVVDNYSKGGNLTNTDLQNGHKVADLMGQKARGLMSGLYGLVTATMTDPAFAVGKVAATPADLSASDLAEINGAIEADTTVALLEPTYHSKFVPTTGDSLALVDGVYGIDRGIKKVTSINATDVVGFIGSKSSIVVCTGLPVNEADASVESEVITLPNGFQVLFSTWYDANAKARKFDFAINAGVSVGLVSEGRVIKSA